MRTSNQWLRAIHEAPTFEHLCEHTLVAARAVAHAEGATFVVRDADQCFYVDEDAIAPLWRGQRFPLTDCITGWAMLNTETAVIGDIYRDDRIPHSAYLPTFVKSLVALPMGDRDVAGAIGVYWAAADHRPDDIQLATLREIARAAGRGIGRLGLDQAPWAPNFAHRDRLNAQVRARLGNDGAVLAAGA